MNAQELRIGNRILTAPIGTDNWREIVVDADVIANVSRGSTYHKYKPMPLTEDLLPSLCFKKGKYDDWHHQNSKIIISHISTDEFFEYEYLAGLRYGYTEMRQLPDVHTLQNLVFGLTGKELIEELKSTNTKYSNEN